MQLAMAPQFYTMNTFSAIEKPFPSKLLLFGEYGILMGHKALAIPFWQFSNRLVKAAFVDKRWDEWITYLEKHNPRLHFSLDLVKLKNDVTDGLTFMGNIPENYGVGSSGALVAAVYAKYSSISKNKEDALEIFKNDLAVMESYFHAQSSGIDPLVSFVQKPLLLESGRIRIVENFTLPPACSFFLMDSGMPGKTGDTVKQIFIKLKEDEFKQTFDEAYARYSNIAIDAIISGDEAKLFKSVLQLSEYQNKAMNSLFTRQVLKIAKQGLAHRQFAVKLCGSGGGGFYLVLSKPGINIDNYVKSAFKWLAVNNRWQSER